MIDPSIKNEKPLKFFEIFEIFIINFKTVFITTILFFLFSLYMNSTIFKSDDIYKASAKYTVDPNKKLYLKRANKFLQNLSSKAYISRAILTTNTLSSADNLNNKVENNIKNNYLLDSQGDFHQSQKDVISFLEMSYVFNKLHEIVGDTNFINSILYEFQNDKIYNYVNIKDIAVDIVASEPFSEKGEHRFQLNIYSQSMLDSGALDIVYKILISNLNKQIKKLFTQTYDHHLLEVDRAVDLLKRENEQLIRHHSILISDRIIFLNEQLKIAKAINLKDSQIKLDKDTQRVSVKIETQSRGTAYEYLRGYAALEAEISILNERKKNISLVRSFSSIRSNQESILILQSPVYRDDLLAHASISIFIDNKFDPFSLQNTTIISSQNKGFTKNFQIVISIFTSLFGFFSSISLIIFYREYQIYKINK